MKVSFIATVYNEEATVERLLQSLFCQSKFPDEIIIVDGGSTDNTVAEISSFQFPVFNARAKIKLIFKKGNRSVGRNEAIKNANNEIIACSDAGCILDKDWMKNIIKPFASSEVDVVAGYYKGIAKTVFQKCLIPYVLVMPDKVNAGNFLPASRSMAFRKSIWEKVGGFDEKYSHNEDYAFAHKLKKNGAHIVFKKNAIANWIPRNNFKDSFRMFFRFAKGDAQSHIFRPKVMMIFLRYLIGLLLALFYLITKSHLILNTLYLILFVYIFWSIIKNFKYVRRIGAIYYLPLIQITSDIAIILGTSIAIIRGKTMYN